MSRKPCKQCPFRRKSLPGFLGESSPERFITTSLSDERMPCHSTINYEDPNWQQKWEAQKIGKECAGNATFFANICKVSRDPTRERVEPDTVNVFDHPRTFIAHHRSSAKSWDEFEEAESKGFRFPWESGE